MPAWEGRGDFLLCQIFPWLSRGAPSSFGFSLKPHAKALTSQEVAAWEGRGDFLYHVDAGGDIAAQALTLAHLVHIWARAGLSFSLVRSRLPTCIDCHT